jgi:hypothetical protein
MPLALPPCGRVNRDQLFGFRNFRVPCSENFAWSVDRGVYGLRYIWNLLHVGCCYCTVQYSAYQVARSRTTYNYKALKGVAKSQKLSRASCLVRYGLCAPFVGCLSEHRGPSVHLDQSYDGNDATAAGATGHLTGRAALSRTRTEAPWSVAHSFNAMGTASCWQDTRLHISIVSANSLY